MKPDCKGKCGHCHDKYGVLLVIGIGVAGSLLTLVVTYLATMP